MRFSPFVQNPNLVSNLTSIPPLPLLLALLFLVEGIFCLFLIAQSRRQNTCSCFILILSSSLLTESTFATLGLHTSQTHILPAKSLLLIEFTPSMHKMLHTRPDEEAYVYI